MPADETTELTIDSEETSPIRSRPCNPARKGRATALAPSITEISAVSAEISEPVKPSARPAQTANTPTTVPAGLDQQKVAEQLCDAAWRAGRLSHEVLGRGGLVENRQDRHQGQRRDVLAEHRRPSSRAITACATNPRRRRLHTRALRTPRCAESPAKSGPPRSSSSHRRDASFPPIRPRIPSKAAWGGAGANLSLDDATHGATEDPKHAQSE